MNKFGKLTNLLCSRHNLTTFEYEAESNIKGKSIELAENCFGKFVKAHQVNLFLADFNNLELLCCVLLSHGSPFCQSSQFSFANVKAKDFCNKNFPDSSSRGSKTVKLLKDS